MKRDMKIRRGITVFTVIKLIRRLFKEFYFLFYYGNLRFLYLNIPPNYSEYFFLPPALFISVIFNVRTLSKYFGYCRKVEIIVRNKGSKNLHQIVFRYLKAITASQFKSSPIISHVFKQSRGVVFGKNVASYLLACICILRIVTLAFS